MGVVVDNLIVHVVGKYPGQEKVGGFIIEITGFIE